MARLTKEERKVFDPTLLIQNQKWKADLLIGKEKEPGKEEGGHSPYQPWKPAPGGPYVPAPGRETANWAFPSGGGHPLTEELYWDGLKTILESTEANSDEQNRRLNILWHQFHDQVKNPANTLKIGMSKKDDDINWQLINNSGGANPEDYLTPKQFERYKRNPERFIDIDLDLVKTPSQQFPRA